MLDHSGLYVDSIACSFAGRRVLSGVYLQCQVGEVIGLLGRNGAGKSTLLKIIFGSQPADHKHIKLNGKLLRQRGYVTGHIAYLPQDFFFPQHLRLAFLIDLYIHKFKQELLAVAIITDFLNKTLGELSGGNRRFVECLLVIYSDATFILLDEPFSQIAPMLIEQIQEHILKFRAIKGFIVTDHYYERILEISTRVILIHNGSNYQINRREDLQTYGYISASAFERKDQDN